MAVMGTFSSFTGARLAIYASQASLNVTGNNIANINTKGFVQLISQGFCFRPQNSVVIGYLPIVGRQRLEGKKVEAQRRRTEFQKHSALLQHGGEEQARHDEDHEVFCALTHTVKKE